MPPLKVKPAVVPPPPEAEEPIRGLYVYTVPGIDVWLPFLSADPLKDSEDFWEQAREGTPQNEFLREYGVDFGVFEGKPVYPEYQDRFHLWPADRGPLRYVANRPIIRGWDIPGPLACAWVQVVPIPKPGSKKTDDPAARIHVLAEMMADSSVSEFGNMVKSFSATQFPQATQYLDWCDPAAWAKQPNDKVSARDELRRKCDIHLNQGPVTLLDRLEPVRRWLTGLMAAAPLGDPPGKFILDWSCLRIRDAMKSGYHYGEIQKGSGRYRDVPEKNAYCVPLGVEALTPEGWRCHDQLRPDQIVYGYDREAGRLRETRVRAVHVFPGVHAAIRLANSRLDVPVTGAHRWVARHKGTAPVLVETQHLNTAHTLVLAAPLARRPRAVYSDAFVRLCAWVMTEGTYRRNGAIVITQSRTHNPKYAEELDALTAQFPGTRAGQVVKPAGVFGVWRITREAAAMVRQAMPDKHPSAAMIVGLTIRQMRLFLYEAIRGDGTWGRGLHGPIPPPPRLDRARAFWVRPTTPRMFQKSSGAVDALQMLGALAGLRIASRSVRSGHLLSFHRQSRRGLWVSSLRQEPTVLDGVWCPETETGTWVGRFNGQVFITGNSHIANALEYAIARADMPMSAKAERVEELKFENYLGRLR